MISGIGADIESIARFKKTRYNKRFLEIIFTKNEIRYCRCKNKPYISFAGKFSAKEAVIKAYDRGISFKDIEIVNLKSGKIAVLINGKRNNHIFCSISHTEEYALAFVIIEKK